MRNPSPLWGPDAGQFDGFEDCGQPSAATAVAPLKVADAALSCAGEGLGQALRSATGTAGRGGGSPRARHNSPKCRRCCSNVASGSAVTEPSRLFAATGLQRLGNLVQRCAAAAPPSVAARAHCAHPALSEAARSAIAPVRSKVPSSKSLPMSRLNSAMASRSHFAAASAASRAYPCTLRAVLLAARGAPSPPSASCANDAARARSSLLASSL